MLQELENEITKYNNEYKTRFKKDSPLVNATLPKKGTYIFSEEFNILIQKINGLIYEKSPIEPQVDGTYTIDDAILGIGQYANDIKGLARCPGCSGECVSGCISSCRGCGDICEGHCTEGCGTCTQSCGDRCHSGCDSGCSGGCNGCSGCSSTCRTYSH